jgi:hypothetical protein
MTEPIVAVQKHLRNVGMEMDGDFFARRHRGADAIADGLGGESADWS